MSRLRSAFVLVAVLGVLAAACGGPSEEAVEPPVVTLALDSSGPSSTTAPLDEPDDAGGTDEPEERAGASALPAVLGDSLEAAIGATHYRIRSYSGQEFRLAGRDLSSPLDLVTPATVVTVTPEGVHYRIDMNALVPALVAPEAIVIETWEYPERMIVDSRSFAALPASDFGPYDPGVSFLDLAALAELGGVDAQTAVGGTTLDLGALARTLVEVVEVVETRGSDPAVYVGTANFADLLEAFGTDVDQYTGGLAAGVSLSLDVDPAVLAAFYADYYRTVPSVIEIEVGADGELLATHMRADLSGAMDAMFDAPELFDRVGVSEAELAAARRQLGDVTMIAETRTEIDVDPSVELPPPPADPEDRTAEWLEFFRTAGLFP